MSHPPRPIRMSQLLGVLALCLALFFVIAFVNQARRANRLAAWRDELVDEIQQMERQRDDLQRELARRQSPEWVDEVLREAGYVPKGVVRVIAQPVTATPSGQQTLAATPEAAAAPTATPGTRWFDNPNWEAWKRLILGAE